MLLRRLFLALSVVCLMGCGGDPVGPGEEFNGFYYLQSIDGQEDGWVVSDSSPVLVEVFEASISLFSDLTCVMRREMSELDKSDPQNWVQTIVEDWAGCTYVIEDGNISLSFPERGGEVRADGGPTFLFPLGGTLTGSYTRVDLPRGDNVFVRRTLTLTEEGSVYVYETPENSGGGGPCVIFC